MEAYIRINPGEATGSKTGGAIGPICRETPDGGGRVARPEPLDLNACISRLIRLLAPDERTRLRAAIGDSVLPVMGDPHQIAAVFFTLVECASRLTPGGSTTVLTTLLPLDAGLISDKADNECALFSFHAAARGGGRICLAGPGYDNAMRPLSNVRSIVEEHDGCFRASLRAAEVTFNIYLPVMSHMPVPAGRDAGVAFAPPVTDRR